LTKNLKTGVTNFREFLTVALPHRALFRARQAFVKSAGSTTQG
jgi:hypothetical protein